MVLIVSQQLDRAKELAMVEIGHKLTHPNPNMADPTIAPIQCIPGRAVHAKMNRPIVVNGAPAIAGGSRNSGSAALGLPVSLEYLSTSRWKFLCQIGSERTARIIPTRSPQKERPICQRLNP